METPSDQEPPVRFVAYPRGQISGGPPEYGSAEKLRALADGYFGLGTAALLNYLLVLIGFAASIEGLQSFGLLALVPAQLVIGLVIGLATYPYAKKVGYGCGWAPTKPAIVSLLLGISTTFCGGIVGFPIVQSLALVEFKKYGIRTGLFGVSRKRVAFELARFNDPSLVSPVFELQPGDYGPNAD